MTTKEIIASIIGAGGLGAIVAWIRGRRKDKADVAVILTDSAMGLVDRLSKTCDELFKQAALSVIMQNEAKVEIDELRIIYDETKILLDEAKAKHKIEVTSLTNKLNDLENLLIIKQQNCTKMQESAKMQKEETEKLRLEIIELKKG